MKPRRLRMKHDLGEWLTHSATPGIWQLLPTGTMTDVYYSYVYIYRWKRDQTLAIATPLPFQSQSNFELAAGIQACMLSYCFRVPSCDINFDNNFLCLPNLLTSQINLIKNPPAWFLRNGKTRCYPKSQALLIVDFYFTYYSITDLNTFT